MINKVCVSDNILWYENYDIENVVTPVKVDELERLLKESRYPDYKIRELVLGFTKGFSLGYQGPEIRRTLSRNHKLRAGNQTILWNKLMKEVMLKRAAGPWEIGDLPFTSFIQSPITLIPKKGASTADDVDSTRLIFDLSSPRGESLNDYTPKEVRSCEYPLFDKSVLMALEQGKGAFMCSADCKSAFKQLPLAPDQYKWVVMMCEHPVTGKKYYFCDKTVCFGSGTSCYLYMKVSNALAHLFRYRTRRTKGDINNFLDDFHTCKKDEVGCNRYLKIFIDICNAIGLPLSEEKIQWATQVMVFLGLLINTILQTVSLPVEKLERAKAELDVLIRAKKVTAKQIQRLAGLLNFFCRAIVPGRAFTRRMYAKIDHLQPYHHLRVDKELRRDCKVWFQFLSMEEAVTRPFMDFKKILHADKLDFYTDAALDQVRLGVGAKFGKYWFSEQMVLPINECIAELNIQVAELYSIFLALALWLEKLNNRRVVIFTDNESVMHMINRSTSANRVCMIMIRYITLWCMKTNTRVFAMHVGTKVNREADLLSRGHWGRYLELHRSEQNSIAFVREELPSDLWPFPIEWLKDKNF